jgi:hypothetical protein
MTKQEELDFKIQEQCLERDKIEFEEQKAQYAFNTEERDFIRKQWESDQRIGNQEVTRRAIETCVNILRNSTAIIKDEDISSEAKQKATEKLLELIPKLG